MTDGFERAASSLPSFNGSSSSSSSALPQSVSSVKRNIHSRNVRTAKRQKLHLPDMDATEDALPMPEAEEAEEADDLQHSHDGPTDLVFGDEEENDDAETEDVDDDGDEKMEDDDDETAELDSSSFYIEMSYLHLCVMSRYLYTKGLLTHDYMQPLSDSLFRRSHFSKMERLGLYSWVFSSNYLFSLGVTRVKLGELRPGCYARPSCKERVIVLSKMLTIDTPSIHMKC